MLNVPSSNDKNKTCHHSSAMSFPNLAYHMSRGVDVLEHIVLMLHHFFPQMTKFEPIFAAGLIG